MYYQFVQSRLLKYKMFILLIVYVCVRSGTAESPTVSQNTTNSVKRPLTLLSLLPYPDPVSQPSWTEGPSLVVAGQLAVNLVNKMADILPDHHLELVIGDSGCELVSKVALATSSHILSGDKTVAGIVGPGCSVSALFVASLISRESTGLVSVHLAGSIQLSDRLTYPNVFGTLDSNIVFVDTLLALAHRNSWRKVVVLFDESLVSSISTLRALKARVFLGNETLQNVFPLAVYDTYVPLQEIKEIHSRIIILLVGPDLFRKIVCVGFHNGILYDSHQWVVVGRTFDDISPLNFTYPQGISYSCDKEEIGMAIDKSIFINYVIKPFDVMERTDSGLSYTQFIDRYSELIEMENRKLVNGEKALEPSYWASAYFDAVWSLALALNNSREEIKNKTGLDLSQYRYGNTVATNIIKRSLLNLDYRGVSGRIKFDKSTGFVTRAVYIHQVLNNTMSRVEYFNGTDILRLGKSSLQYIDDSLDLIITQAPLGVGVFFTFMSLINILVLIASQVAVIVYRNYPSVKASSTQFLHVSFVGCYLLNFGSISYILAYSFDTPPQTKCNLLQVSNTVFIAGLTLVFGSLSAKTWRLYRIFVHYLDPGPLISNKVLFSYIAGLVLVEVPVLLAWDIYDPQSPFEQQFPEVGMVLYRCGTPNYYVWLGTLLGFNSCIMLLTLLLALLCHQIPNRDFMTNSSIILVYILIIDIVLGLPIFYYIPISANVVPEFLVLNMTINVSLYACLVLLFWIPLFPAFKKILVLKSKVKSKSKTNLTERK